MSKLLGASYSIAPVWGREPKSFLQTAFELYRLPLHHRVVAGYIPFGENMMRVFLEREYRMILIHREPIAALESLYWDIKDNENSPWRFFVGEKLRPHELSMAVADVFLPRMCSVSLWASRLPRDRVLVQSYDDFVILPISAITQAVSFSFHMDEKMSATSRLKVAGKCLEHKPIYIQQERVAIKKRPEYKAILKNISGESE